LKDFLKDEPDKYMYPPIPLEPPYTVVSRLNPGKTLANMLNYVTPMITFSESAWTLIPPTLDSDLAIHKQWYSDFLKIYYGEKWPVYISPSITSLYNNSEL